MEQLKAKAQSLLEAIKVIEYHGKEEEVANIEKAIKDELYQGAMNLSKMVLRDLLNNK